jgi:hypothetical protein
VHLSSHDSFHQRPPVIGSFNYLLQGRFFKGALPDFYRHVLRCRQCVFFQIFFSISSQLAAK